MSSCSLRCDQNVVETGVLPSATQVLLQGLRADTGWRERLVSEFYQPYMQALGAFLAEEELAGKVLFPSHQDRFGALNSAPFERVRVVMLGQDPYHGPGQAHGLCFSVRPQVPAPPSLLNIFKELERDLGIPRPEHGCLQSWAEQGVLLLNSILTVVQGQAGSHQGKGWETFTDKIIQCLNDEGEGIIFLLWGNYAQKKGRFIDRQRHRVLLAPHPSPLSAHRGFLGCSHFTAVNHWLIRQGRLPIDWSLPPLADVLAGDQASA